MSIDLEPHSEMHGGSEGHHESPEKVDSRQRLGVWLFIGADVVTLGALLFTYLYLRGVNTDGHWMTMMGYKGSLHSYSDWENLYAAGTLKAPTLIHVPLISAGLQWLIAALTVVSAGVLWLGEKALRTSKNAKAFSSVALSRWRLRSSELSLGRSC